MTSPCPFSPYFILDEDFGLLAYSTSDRLDTSKAELKCDTRINFDSRSIIRGILDQAVALSSGAYEIPNRLFHRSQYPKWGSDDSPDAEPPEMVETVVFDRSSLPPEAQASPGTPSERSTGSRPKCWPVRG